MSDDPLADPAPALPEHSRDNDERTTLVEMLDYYRAVLLRKAWRLDSAQLARRLGPSSLTLGGLIKHMALVEHSWFHERFLGQPEGEPWASVDWDTEPDWEFRTAADDSPADLVALYQREVDTARAIIAAAPDLDAQLPDAPHPTNLRWVLVHMIEEYARHCGHADLLRESIDGQTGD